MVNEQKSQEKKEQVREKFKKRIVSAICVTLFWLIVWQLLAMYLSNKNACFAGPIDTFNVFVEESGNKEFWDAIILTFTGLAGGYLVALVIATFIGYFAYFKGRLKNVLGPFFSFFGYIPMISFTVAATIWFEGDNLFVPVSIFLSIPVIYKNTVIALEKFDQHYINRAKELNMSFRKKMAYLYRPSLMPDYIVGCHRGLSMCWKSGIIAQYLANSGLSIGAHLFDAKANYDMARIFAWTIIIVILSKTFEFLVLEFLSSKFINHADVGMDDIYEMITDETESL